MNERKRNSERLWRIRHPHRHAVGHLLATQDARDRADNREMARARPVPSRPQRSRRSVTADRRDSDRVHLRAAVVWVVG